MSRLAPSGRHLVLPILVVRMRVLVAEDDAGLRSVLQRSLEENGYVVDAVTDGEEAIRYLTAREYDVAVLDWRMPGQTGVDVVATMRRRQDRTPVLMLTALDDHRHRVAGLDQGADDYLVKPFDLGELLARLRALQRRPALAHPDLVRCGDLTFDPATREVRRHGPDEPEGDGTAVALTSIELALLELLMRRCPQVVGRRAIALQAWPDEVQAVGSNTIDVHVARLRSKLSGARARIETVRGVGYRMVEQ